MEGVESPIGVESREHGKNQEMRSLDNPSGEYCYEGEETEAVVAQCTRQESHRGR